MLSRVFNTSRTNCSKIAQRKTFSTISNSIEHPGRVVFISQSLEPTANLAFEDWLYKNWNFSKRSVLFLWRNSPSVIIGRHQNPFIEANLEYLHLGGVPVIRRNSGGGAVYHDDGNINCTFFTSRDRYNRRGNLELICSALQKDFNIPAGINKKDDIVIGNEVKVSGTAAKLGRLTAYHHCTLLVSSDKKQLSLALKGDKTLKSKATPSVPSAISNLNEICPDLSVQRVLASIAKNYVNQTSLLQDAQESSRQSDGFTLINPTEEWFPGLDELKSKLSSWNWLYGMTPDFKTTRPVAVDASLLEGSSVLVTAEIHRGIIKKISVDSTSVGSTFKDWIENRIGTALVGTRYTPDLFAEIETQISIRKQEKIELASLNLA